MDELKTSLEFSQDEIEKIKIIITGNVPETQR